MRQRLRLYILRAMSFVAGWLTRRQATGTRRILVVKPDHLGDVLLLTPALRLLRQQLPQAHITLLIGPWSTAAVRHNPDVNTVLTCSFPGFTRSTKPSLLQPYLILLRMALLLRPHRYDVALIARDDHWWGALLATLAGIPQRIGYNVSETAPFLTEALPHSFTTHVTTQALDLVTALTQQTPDQRPTLRAPINDTDRTWADAWLAQHHVLPTEPLVAIHPGAGGAAKLWPQQRWIEIVAALRQRGLQVVLTGGVGERELVDAIAGQLSPVPLTLVGDASISQLTALYARCILVLGVDSGPLHLAVAAGVPTIALFGPGDHQRFGPWGHQDRNIVLRSGLWCSPCGVLDVCPRGTAPSECMTLIPAASVLTAVDLLLQPVLKI